MALIECSVWPVSKSVVIAVGILWFCGLIPTGKSSTTPVCSNASDNATVKLCCLCDEQNGCEDTNTTCPEGYQLTNITSDICWPEFTSQLTTASTTGVPTTTTGTLTTDPVTIGPERTSSLCHKCNKTEYFNETLCLACDPLCAACVGPENCTHCRFLHNDTCVESCPNGTDESHVNDIEGIKCVIKQVETKTKIPYAIIAGVGGGGLIIIVIVVIVIVIVCRRKRSSRQQTRMSQIITERPSQVNKRPASSPTTVIAPSRRRNYENQPDPGAATFPRDIQEQSDNVLRYTQDPTGRKKVLKTGPNHDVSDTYANAAMIRVTAALVKGDENVSPDRLQQHLEHEEIENLPNAPALPKQSKKRKSLIQQVSKHFFGNKQSTKIPQPDEGEEYIDMDQGLIDMKKAPKQNSKKTELDNTELEDYENLQMKSKTNNDSESDKEDYENMNTLKKPEKRKKQFIEEPEQESYENVAFVSEDKNKIDQSDHSKSNTKDNGGGVDIVDAVDDQQEDYENTAAHKKPEVHRGGTSKQGRQTGMAKDAGAGNVEDDLEDYENTAAHKKPEVNRGGTSKQGRQTGTAKDAGAGNAEDDLEDYENTAAHKKPKVNIGGTSKQSRQTGTAKDAGAGNAEDILEDYENAGTYRKNVVAMETDGKEENLYQNVEFRKK